MKVLKWFDIKLKWGNGAKSILEICMGIIKVCPAMELKEMLSVMKRNSHLWWECGKLARLKGVDDVTAEMLNCVCSLLMEWLCLLF